LIPSYFIWLVFALPYAGALVTVAVRKAGRAGDYLAVGFSMISAGFALTMLIPFLEGQPLGVDYTIVPQHVPWISGLNLTMGVLSDPYTAILTNVVAWVSFGWVKFQEPLHNDDMVVLGRESDWVSNPLQLACGRHHGHYFARVLDSPEARGAR